MNKYPLDYVNGDNEYLQCVICSGLCCDDVICKLRLNKKYRSLNDTARKIINQFERKAHEEQQSTTLEYLEEAKEIDRLEAKLID